MALFRRRRAEDGQEAAAGTTTTTEDVADAAADAGTAGPEGPDATQEHAPVATPSARRAGGPYDVDDPAVPAGERVDVGALRIPAVAGMNLRMEIDKESNAVQSASVVLDGSALQVQAFAAPRTDGIWDEIRTEILAQVTQQGGAADDLEGPFGREVLARLPVRTPEGRTAHRPFRFVGADGPRWFVRGVLSGRAAVDPAAAGALEDVFAGIVVVRGGDARPPRELLPLALPGGRPVPVPTDEAPAAPPVDPFVRGPEMTETR